MNFSQRPPGRCEIFFDKLTLVTMCQKQYYLVRKMT